MNPDDWRGACPAIAYIPIQLPRLFLNPLPRLLHVSSHRVGLPYAKPQRHAAVEPRMCQVKIAATVKPIHQCLIAFVAALMAEADQI